MDVLFELLKELAASMNLGTFLLVLTIIGLSSVILGTFLARNSTKKTGFWALFRSTEGRANSDEQREVKTTISRLQELLIKFAEVEKEDNQSIKEQLARTLMLKSDIETARDAILKELENTKYIIKMKDEHSILVQENINNFLQKLSEQLSKVADQIDKVDEISRDMGTEFRADHKDLTKGLSDLSKDVALIERTIQTQINTIGVKLRQ